MTGAIQINLRRSQHPSQAEPEEQPGLINYNEGRCQCVLFGGGCFGGLAPGVICRDANGNVGVCPQSLRGGTRFAFDLGEVIEFYPTRRLILRVDLGDTVIRNSQPGRTSHNFQTGASIGIRF